MQRTTRNNKTLKHPGVGAGFHPPSPLEVFDLYLLGRWRWHPISLGRVEVAPHLTWEDIPALLRRLEVTPISDEKVKVVRNFFCEGGWHAISLEIVGNR